MHYPLEEQVVRLSRNEAFELLQPCPQLDELPNKKHSLLRPLYLTAEEI